MSKRPIFQPIKEGKNLVKKYDIEFTWYPGFSKEQKQKSIESLHSEAKKNYSLSKILEISTKSKDSIGISCSAFNLKLQTQSGVVSTVESMYQGSKVFERGGPYKDLYNKSSLDAKKDERLKNSGNLKNFDFQGILWGLNDFFYDWLYMNALLQNQSLADKLIEYDAFSDIEFNPKKSFNCQAYSASLYNAALMRDYDINLIKSPSDFKKLFPREVFSLIQGELF
tara:strand:+ start:126 stop:800 length:675 start_codon:yes stop_codon:yes gene_type:complete